MVNLWFKERIFSNSRAIKRTNVQKGITRISVFHLKAKQKYRGVFETQKSGDKTSSGEIGINIRTFASPKVGQDQVSRGVSVKVIHGTLLIKKITGSAHLLK